MTDAEPIIKISEKQATKFRAQMLEWYDNYGRTTIPWRAPKGVTPDPYHIWLSEIMCQQTTVQAVCPYFLKFISIWPNVHNLASALTEDVMREWAGLGYYARARNLHKCAKIVSVELGGAFPDNKCGLLQLPGIGDYTASAIASIAFNRSEIVVDGNVERVMARYFAIDEPVPPAKKKLKELAAQFYQGKMERPGDYAQSLMDLGAMICTPKSPKCALCPVNNNCAAYTLGYPERYPKRLPKLAKPQKFGQVFWVEDKQGNVILERRPENIMMGGMIGLPTTEWIEGEGNDINSSGIIPPFPLKGLDIIGVVKHSFTHFDLTLAVIKGYSSDNPSDLTQPYFKVKLKELQPSHFPTLFKKAVNLCLV